MAVSYTHLDVYKRQMGTSVARIFDYTAALTGVNEKTLRSMGKVKGTDYETCLLYTSKDGRILRR